jgi:superfamily I DNA and/or RNA helicase
LVDFIAREDRINELRDELSATRHSLDEQMLATLDPDDRLYLTQELDRVTSAMAKLAEQRVALEDEAAAKEVELLRSAPVVGTTLATLLLKAGLFDRRFDIVIVDEAAAASPVLVLLAATRALRSVALVGDFLQNEPVTRYGSLRHHTPPALTGRALRCLGGNVFELAGVGCPGDAVNHPRCARLVEQYRFSAPVADVVNEFAYDGLLRTGAGAGGAPLLDGLGPCVFVDTSNGYLDARVQSEDGSRWWRPGLDVTEQLVARHVGDGQVGVITPYVAQARRLNRLTCVRSSVDVEAGTIHEFQGREFPIVVFDLVQDQGSPTWASDANFNGNARARTGARILNVALTRTQSRVYIIGDWTAVERHAGPHRPGLKALLSARQRGSLDVVSPANLT